MIRRLVCFLVGHIPGDVAEVQYHARAYKFRTCRRCSTPTAVN